MNTQDNEVFSWMLGIRVYLKHRPYVNPAFITILTKSYHLVMNGKSYEIGYLSFTMYPKTQSFTPIGCTS